MGMQDGKAFNIVCTDTYGGSPGHGMVSLPKDTYIITSMILHKSLTIANIPSKLMFGNHWQSCKWRHSLLLRNFSIPCDITCYNVQFSHVRVHIPQWECLPDALKLYITSPVLRNKLTHLLTLLGTQRNSQQYHQCLAVCRCTTPSWISWESSRHDEQFMFEDFMILQLVCTQFQMTCSHSMVIMWHVMEYCALCNVQLALEIVKLLWTHFLTNLHVKATLPMQAYSFPSPLSPPPHHVRLLLIEDCSSLQIVLRRTQHQGDRILQLKAVSDLLPQSYRPITLGEGEGKGRNTSQQWGVI